MTKSIKNWKIIEKKTIKYIDKLFCVYCYVSATWYITVLISIEIWMFWKSPDLLADFEMKNVCLKWTWDI